MEGIKKKPLTSGQCKCGYRHTKKIPWTCAAEVSAPPGILIIIISAVSGRSCSVCGVCPATLIHSRKMLEQWPIAGLTAGHGGLVRR
jgi:hypothetical protein